MVPCGIFVLSFVTIVSCANVYYPHLHPTDKVISWKQISRSSISQDHSRRKRQDASLQQSLQNLQRVQQQQSRNQGTTAQNSSQINNRQAESSKLEGFYSWKELENNSKSSNVQELEAVTEDISSFSNTAGFSKASTGASYNNQGSFSGSNKGTTWSNNNNQRPLPGSSGGTILPSYNNQGSFPGFGRGTTASGYNNRESGTGFKWGGSTGSSTSKQGSQQPGINLRSPAFVESNTIAGRFGGSQMTEQHTEDAACIRQCESVGNYSPVCGTDNVSYSNAQKLSCAQKCGRPVKIDYPGVCAITV